MTEKLMVCVDTQWVVVVGVCQILFRDYAKIEELKKACIKLIIGI